MPIGCDTMENKKAITTMNDIYNQATSYLSDHQLEFHELYDMFCSSKIKDILADQSLGIDGGVVYETIIKAFEAKYNVVFKMLTNKSDKGITYVDEVKDLDYQSFFIKLMDDNVLTPRELYMLETTTKEISTKEKYKCISQILDYMSSYGVLYKKKATIADYEKQMKKLRDGSGIDKVQLFKIESYVIMSLKKK